MRLVLSKDSLILDVSTAGRAVTGWVWAAAGAIGLERRCAAGEGLGDILVETPRWLEPWVWSPGVKSELRACLLTRGLTGGIEGQWETRALASLVLRLPVPGAFAKVKESQRMSDEGRMAQDEADGIRRRCRVVGFALQAEMNHFHQRRELDFKHMMQNYLRQQILFYQRVGQQLEKTLRMYDHL